MKYRQKLVNILAEAVKDNMPRQLPDVPGVKYCTHDVSGLKYFSLRHHPSKKFIMKPVHATQIKKTVDLASHHLRDFDFTKSPEELKGQLPHIHKALDLLRDDIDRIHKPELDRVHKKKK